MCIRADIGPAFPASGAGGVIIAAVDDSYRHGRAGGIFLGERKVTATHEVFQIRAVTLKLPTRRIIINLIDDFRLARFVQASLFLELIELAQGIIAQAHEQLPFRFLILAHRTAAGFGQPGEMDGLQSGIFPGLVRDVFPHFIGGENQHRSEQFAEGDHDRVHDGLTSPPKRTAGDFAVKPIFHRVAIHGTQLHRAEIMHQTEDAVELIRIIRFGHVRDEHMEDGGCNELLPGGLGEACQCMMFDLDVEMTEEYNA